MTVGTPAAGVCPAIHGRLVRRRAVARTVRRAVSSALERIAHALSARSPV
jgi:hypothetical protein